MVMQQYSIGRGDDCRIRIHDNSQRVSRNHATLKVMDNGKIFITDHSSNGTYVNGIKISQNVDFPVKRGDSVSFANTAELNWDLIPRKPNKVLLYLMIALVVIAIGVAGGYLWKEKKQRTPSTPTEALVPDSTEINRKKLERDKFLEDSLKQVKQDSINKAKDKELEEAKRKLKEKETQENKRTPEPEKSATDTTKVKDKDKPEQLHIL